MDLVIRREVETHVTELGMVTLKRGLSNDTLGLQATKMKTGIEDTKRISVRRLHFINSLFNLT